MLENIDSILESYTSRGYKYDVRLEASKDTRLTTEILIQKSLELTVPKRKNPDLVNFPLLVLRLRADDKVLTSAFSLLQSEVALERELGCDILREMPFMDDAPYPHSLKAIKAIELLIETEDNDDVLESALIAIGRQCHEVGQRILLKYKNDHRENIRYIVVSNILNGYSTENGVPDSISNALLNFISDADQDIRWSILYDVAEFPEVFSKYASQFMTACKLAQNDNSDEVREQADRAYNAIKKFVSV